jgi:ribonuclease P protein component
MTRPEDGLSSTAHAASGVRLGVSRQKKPGVARLKKRADFVAAAKGRRQHQRNFVLQARERTESPEPECGPASSPRIDLPRVGFTVTKKVGNAVVRNRIRRRFREAVRLSEESLFRPGCDYVLAARREALAASFDDLRGELARALKKIHQSGPRRPPAVPAADRKQDL